MATNLPTGSQSAFVSIAVPNLDEVVRQLGGITDQLVANMRGAMTESNAELLKAVVKNLNEQIYNRPRDKRRGRQLTGTLRRSWALKPVTAVQGTNGPAGFTGGAGSRLVYAPIIEFGYDGPVRAHVRRQRSRHLQESVEFATASGRIKSRNVGERLATGIAFVRAHHRVQRARPYAIPALADAKSKIEQAHAAAADAALKGKNY